VRLAEKAKQTRDAFRRRRNHHHRISENTLKNSSFIPSRSYVPSRCDDSLEGSNQNFDRTTSPSPAHPNASEQNSQPAAISSLDLKGLLCADATINFEDLKLKANGFRRIAGTTTPDGTSRQIHTSRYDYTDRGPKKILGRPSSAPASKVRGRNSASQTKLNGTIDVWGDISAPSPSATMPRAIQSEVEVARNDMEVFEQRVRRKKLVDTRAGTDVFSIDQIGTNRIR